MVEEHLRGRGICDERVMAAMAKVPREEFVPTEHAAAAYGDFPIAIGAGQTISQPYIVASMLEKLDIRPEHRVLEVGTGTGYGAALLGELAEEVWTIERHAELVEKAQVILARLGYANAHVLHGDGSSGLPERGLFDRILVAAAAPSVPKALLDQLADGGKLIIPVGNRYQQVLQLVRKIGDEVAVVEAEACRFVPLVGEHGWRE